MNYNTASANRNYPPKTYGIAVRCVADTGLNNTSYSDTMNGFTIYPNPATDIINIALTINKISNKVSYEIVDINGKSIAISSKSNIKSDNISFNTSKLSNGTYFVKIATESGKTQLKFTVSK